ncbi:transposase, partial [Mediterraneibacter gnavus]
MYNICYSYDETNSQMLSSLCNEKDWIPHCKKAFNGAQSVIHYLGKY